MSAKPPQRRWAPRVRQSLIRALYESERQGRLDSELVREVGWTLWERAGDVILVSEATLTGVVECPACGKSAQRLRKSRQQEAWAPANRSLRCEQCGYEGSWGEIRGELRRAPLCLKCHTPLEWRYRREELACPHCGDTVPHRIWRRRLRRRVLLPCPGCKTPLRVPLSDPSAGRPLRPERDSASREPDAVRCANCDWEGHWSLFKQSWRGAKLLTGSGMVPCTRFRDAWPQSRDAAKQMLLIDVFIHALHFGPLAPLFIAGERDSVLALLDELAG